MSTNNPLNLPNAPAVLRLGGRDEISSLRRLSQLQPQDAAIWRRLGYAELAAGDARSATASYRRAIELEPANARGHNNLGQALMRLQRRAEAIACYRRATGLDPAHATAHNNLGIALYEEGETDAALESYRRALALDPKLAEAHHNYGNALLRAERYPEALACYERAIQLRPASAHILTGLGDALAKLGRRSDALAAYEKGLLLDPQSVRLLARMSAMLVELKRPLDALTYCERALRYSPHNAAAQNDRAAVLNMLGRFEEALESCARALELQADLPEALASRAFALRQLHRYEDALAACEQAVALRQDSIAALSTRAEVLIAMGQHETARDSMRRILQIDPDRADIRTLRVMSHIPQIPSNLQEVAASRGAFAVELADLDHWLEIHPDLDESTIVGHSTPFYLAYQHTCNRDLLVRHGQLCCKLMSRWEKREAMSESKAGKRASDKLRVGIVSSHIRDHSVYRALTRGWLGHLDRRRMEVGVVHLGVTQDEQTLWARTHADFFLDGVRSLSQWVEAIRHSGLDVLIFPEIGMHMLTLQLASLRLAPYQIAAWGHPETTGLATIDYYLSGQCFEPPQAQDYYSEKLVPLAHLGCYYEPYGFSPLCVDPVRWGINYETPVFICAGMPFKYAPQYDHVFVEIARRLGRCQFVFFESPVPRLTEQLRARLSEACRDGRVEPSDHLVFIPWQQPAEFFSLMRQGGVLLDTIGFSGFNTVMQAIECDLPAVTFEGRFMRGRLGSGIMLRADLPELIARTGDEYIELASRLATDRIFRRTVQQRMAIAKGRLFRDRAAIDSLEEFLGGLQRLAGSNDFIKVK